MDGGTMGLRDRLGRLEQSTQKHRSEAANEAEKRTSREVLRRMTDDELCAYVDVLSRMRDGEEPGEENVSILTRVQELREEVTSGHQATPR
jgi:hypothetical protein